MISFNKSSLDDIIWAEYLEALGEVPIYCPVQVLMSYGKFFITNNRIIAQGEIRVKGGRAGTYGILDLVILPLSGHSKRGKIRKDLPRDGHEIPINNIGRLRKIRNGITFEVMGGDRPGVVNIKPSKMLFHGELLKKHKNKLFELLSEFNKTESPNYARRRHLEGMNGYGKQSHETFSNKITYLLT
ncbi:MAG TPA: hypothetical protein ENI29_14085 [bacterium]|nr:hypothetical protein [bacterium]